MATYTETKNKELREDRVELPEGVGATLNGSILTIKGPLGEVKQDLSKIMINISVNEDAVKVTPFSSRRRHVAVAGTARSLINNMITGVTKGFTYRLKIAYAHFPVTVKVKGKEVHIENFYGERAPRIASIIGDCKINVEEDDVVIRGVSIADVGQTAANIEQVTTVKRKDQRVFLDGVYVYEKRRGEY